MRFRASSRGLGAFVALALAAALTLAASAQKAPSPPPAPGRAPIRAYINGIPDTGQFLPDTTVIAQVDELPITIRDFIWSYFNSYAEDRPSQDSLGRVTFLQTMVNKEVLGRTARKANYPLTYEDRVTLREHTQRVLANDLYHHAVLDSSDATEAEIQRVYEQFKWELHVRHILFANAATAEKVRVDLRAGRISWTAAVKKYSVAVGDKGPDGDVGWLVRVGLSLPIADALFNLKPNEISAVVEDEDGPQLVQCVERRPTKPMALSSVRALIVDQIRAAHATAMTDRFYLGLAKDVHFVPDTAVINWACKFFKPPVQSKTGDGGPSIELNAEFPNFSADDTSRVLARWDGGRISVHDFLESFSNIPPLVRPDCSTPQALTMQVANVVLEPYRAQIAQQRGYDRDPPAVAEIEGKREQLMVEHMYADSVENRIRVTPAERRDYYEKHKPDYFTYESRTFATIIRFSKAGTDSVVKALRSGTPAGAIISADSAAGFKSGAFHELRQDEHGTPFRKLVYEELRPGEVTTVEPRKSGDVWVVVQLVHVTPGHQLSFEESQSMIDVSLRAMKAETELQNLLKRLRPRFRIIQHPELVMRIRLLDPTS